MPAEDTGAIHSIAVHLDRLLAERDMTLAELADRTGITVANLSILKNGRARAIRFTTLTRLCDVLHCQPGDLLSYQETQAPASSRLVLHTATSASQAADPVASAGQVVGAL